MIPHPKRLSEGQHSPHVEVHVRVPLEKEVPVTPVTEEPKPLEEEPEFPELTEVWSLHLYVLEIFTTNVWSNNVSFFLFKVQI